MLQAAAIMASALLELCRYTDHKSGREYFNIAQSIVKTLSLPSYKAAAGTNGGFYFTAWRRAFTRRYEIDVSANLCRLLFIEAMKDTRHLELKTNRRQN